MRCSWFLSAFCILLLLDTYSCLDDNCSIDSDCKGVGQTCLMIAGHGKCKCKAPCYKDVAHKCVRTGDCLKDSDCRGLGAQGFCKKSTNTTTCACGCKAITHKLKNGTCIDALKRRKGSGSSTTAVAVVVPILLLVCIVVVVGWLLWKRKKGQERVPLIVS